jgi:hypothetical protein
MPMTRYWTAAEIAALREGVTRGDDWARIAAATGRAPGACEAMAVKLRQRGLLQRALPTGTQGRLAGPPKPGSNLDRLVQLLRQLAIEGAPLPPRDEIAGLIGVATFNSVSTLYSQAAARGLIVIRYARWGIAQVEAPDGTWCVAGGRAAPPPPERKCLGCGRPFASEHRFNRVCLGCKSTQAWSSGVAT